MELNQDPLPIVGRPKGAIWRRLETEGVDWEGQVLISGDEVDLAALLVVTPLRMALCRGGAIVLDFAQDWLYPDPHLRADGLIELSISPPTTLDAETILLKVRGGHRQSASLISALTSDLPPIALQPPGPDFDDLVELAPASPQRQTRWAWRRQQTRAQATPVQPVDLLTLLTALDADDFPPVIPAKHANSGVWSGDTSSSPAMTTETGQTWEPQAPGWSPKPISGLKPRTSRHSRSGWVVRLSGLVLLLVAASAIDSGWRPDDLLSDDGTIVVPIVAIVDAPSPTPTLEMVISVPTTAPTIDVNDYASAEQTSIALGVGGGDLPATPVVTESTVTPAQTPIQLPVSSVPSEQASSTAILELAPTDSPPTQTPIPSTETATVLPAASATSESAVSPTREVVFAPPAATTVPTIEPTQQPVLVERATESSATPTVNAAISLEEQRASVAKGETPGQVVSDGTLRYTITSAQRAESLQDLTLPPVTGSDWVVLTVDVNNLTGTNSSLAVDSLSLRASAVPDTLIPIDETSRAVAEYLGYAPAFGVGDTVALGPGESAQLVLAWLVTSDTAELQFVAGDTTTDLAFALAQPPVDDGLVTAAPELVQGTVTRVLDGQTIEVDINGDITQVQYLGIAAPVENACYAKEATAANTALVGSRTVWLERERDHQNSAGLYSRDVWLVDDNGQQLLVAAELASAGAVTPDPVEPDIRYADWIAAAAASAESAKAGLWGVCGGTA